MDNLTPATDRKRENLTAELVARGQPPNDRMHHLIDELSRRRSNELVEQYQCAKYIYCNRYNLEDVRRFLDIALPKPYSLNEWDGVKKYSYYQLPGKPEEVFQSGWAKNHPFSRLVDSSYTASECAAVFEAWGAFLCAADKSATQNNFWPFFVDRAVRGLIAASRAEIARSLEDRNRAELQAVEYQKQAELEAIKYQKQAELEAIKNRQLARYTRAQELQRVAKESSNEALLLFESLPSLYEEADVELTDAHRHFAARAYSPFWTSMETCFEALARFHQAGREIRAAAETYSSAVLEYQREFAEDEPVTLAPFSLSVNEIQSADSARELAAESAELMYSAQRDQTFALIWEQRRSTAAIIEGFGTLDRAVSKLERSMAQEMKSLSRQISIAQEDASDRDQTKLEVARRTAAGVAANLLILQEAHRRATGSYAMLPIISD